MLPAGCHVAGPHPLLVTSRLRQLTLGSACSAGGDLRLLSSRQQQAAQPASRVQPGAFCSFAYCCSDANTLSLVICRWGMHPWTRSLLQQHQVPDRALKGGGTALVASCSNLTDRLPVGTSAVSGQAFHQLPFVKPFSGQSCQQAGRAARGGCREARPWCNALQAACPCAAGIERARCHGNPAGMTSHQPQRAGVPGTSPGSRMPGELAPFVLQSLHLTEERGRIIYHLPPPELITSYLAVQQTLRQPAATRMPAANTAGPCQLPPVPDTCMLGTAACWERLCQMRQRQHRGSQLPHAPCSRCRGWCRCAGHGRTVAAQPRSETPLSLGRLYFYNCPFRQRIQT